MADGTSAESVVRRPAPALRGLVHRYSGYRFVGFPGGRHVGLPGRHVTLILSLAEPVVVEPTVDRDRVEAVTMVGGLHAGPVVIAHDGHEVGIHVDVEPWALPALFGSSPRSLVGEVTELASLLPGAVVRELEERVRTARDWAGRFAILDEVLLRGVRRAAGTSPEVAESWRRLVASGGTASVAALAEEVGWSRRHLAERFGEQVGLTPKALGRVVRFQRAVDLLKATPSRSLADLAARTGYADQPHLNREFRVMTGLSPTAWMAAEDLPFVQDVDHVDGAPWAA